MTVALVIIFVGLLLFFSHFFTAIFEKVGIPDVLFLLVVGLILGPGLGLVGESDFGAVGKVFTTIALVGILFESGLGLNFAQLSDSMMPTLRITVVSFVATVLAVAPVGVLVLGLTVAEGVVLGSIIAGTSSAVVIPLVGKLGLGSRAATTLLLESTFSDVLCIVVTLGVLTAMTSASVEVAGLIGQSIASFIVPAVIGAGFAIGWSVLLQRVRRLDNSISLTLAVVFVLFGTNETMGYSGAIASLSFGVLLGNIETVTSSSLWKFKSVKAVRLNDNERGFYAELAFVIKTLFFVYVGVVMPLGNLSALLIGLGITVVAFVIRVPVVRLTLRNGFSRRDASLAAIMTPKGLAAAVLAALPLQAGLAGGETIQAVVYAIILFSIVLTALLSFLLGKSLVGFPWTWAFAGYPSNLDDVDDVPSRDAMTLVTVSSGTTIPPGVDTWPPEASAPERDLLFDDQDDGEFSEPAWASVDAVSPAEETGPPPAAASAAPRRTGNRRSNRDDDATVIDVPDDEEPALRDDRPRKATSADLDRSSASGSTAPPVVMDEEEGDLLFPD